MCNIVLTVRINLKLPKKRKESDIVLLFYIATHDQTIYLIWPGPCGATSIDIIMNIVYL